MQKMEKKLPLVSPEDAALFREAAQGARPLDTRHARHHSAKQQKKNPRVMVRRQADFPDLRDDWPEIVFAETALLFKKAGLDQALWRRLRRGEMVPDAVLDLHGAIVAEARHALQYCLTDALAHGYQCIRIIHGKSASKPNGTPLLKNYVNGWLRQAPEVLAFCSALPRHGGTGSVYVLLESRKSV